jgi:hypothetical protein
MRLLVIFVVASSSSDPTGCLNWARESEKETGIRVGHEKAIGRNTTETPM